ncbi:MAG: gamma-glutamyl-gamma-aminobutyrate hydrolase family protein [Anaerolineae bacterium]
MPQPTIGIPVFHAYSGKPDWVLPEAYPQAILAAGGIPLLLPLTDDGTVLHRLVGMLDGLLLAGGGDVEPQRYGAQPGRDLIYMDSLRDSTEITLTQLAVTEGIPVLGICRGTQVLNVALGGSLIQDIPSEVPGSAQHRLPDSPDRQRALHPVKVAADSLLAGALGLEGDVDPAPVWVNSRHHQAIAELGSGLVVSARSTADDIVEAVEMPDYPSFFLGVQWHPESMVPEDAQMVRLFRRFVAVCDSGEQWL